MPVSGFFINVTNIAGDYVYGTQMSVYVADLVVSLDLTASAHVPKLER
jgi:hypothetical protein